jgi:hypothetical protein
MHRRQAPKVMQKRKLREMGKPIRREGWPQLLFLKKRGRSQIERKKRWRKCG